jgi:hypothetical protein
MGRNVSTTFICQASDFHIFLYVLVAQRLMHALHAKASSLAS